MYHPTCPQCFSRKTVKFGLPRWKCKRCRKTFRKRRPDLRDRAAIAGYVLDRSTYKRLGDRWSVSRSTAYERVRRALQKRKTLLRRTKVNIIRTDGICLLDAKHRRIGGKPYTIFVAWDRGLGQPIHALLREGGEKELWYWKMMIDLKHVGYRPKGFVSDGFKALKEFIGDMYSGLPHQRCTAHVFLFAKSKVAPGRNVTERALAFLESLKKILWASNIRLARKRLHALARRRTLHPGEKKALATVAKALAECFVCRDPKWRHLALPRTSNAIENVMGQLEARFKTMRGSKKQGSLELLMNEILLQIAPQSINQ